MSLSVVKVFSILVASGNGRKCNSLRAALNDHLFDQDEQTGVSKVFLHKTKDPKYLEDNVRIRGELSHVVAPSLLGISKHFYGPDQKKKDGSAN